MQYNFLLHLHPRKIRAASIRLNLTFGLGGISALLFTIQIITGLLLKYHYQPSPAHAYDSILYIDNNLFFGGLIRSIHHWAAILMIWSVFLHMLRVVFTGAFHKPRHISWVVGVFMLILVVLSNFTGYLLPWDQLSYWAVTIATNLIQYIPLVGDMLYATMIGGDEINEITLSNFYHLHTGIFPISIFLLMTWHFWKIRKADGVIQSKKDKESKYINTNPHLIKKEAVVALVVIAILLILSILFSAPLLERANPLESPNPAKAPWYFMGFQEMLMHFDPAFIITILPLAMLIFMLFIPFTKSDSDNSGLWFGSIQGKTSAKRALYFSLVGTILFLAISYILPDPQSTIPGIPNFITSGIIPALIIGLSIWFFLKISRKKLGLTTLEIIQAIFIIFTISYTILSITGIFFRGEGMELMWPWMVKP